MVSNAATHNSYFKWTPFLCFMINSSNMTQLSGVMLKLLTLFNDTPRMISKLLFVFYAFTE